MIPCCFHPTHVVIVNDSHKLLSNLEDHLPKSHMTFDFFDSQDKALHYINEVYQPEPFYDRYKVNHQQVREKTYPFKSQIIDTHREIYRPQRFDEISTLLMHYSPQTSFATTTHTDGSKKTSGLEFFEKVKNPHIQKIILVEEGDEKHAIQAVNSGQVQYYVCKQELDWEERLYDILQEAQWQYFNKLSEVFMSSIRPGVVKEYALDDPHFQKFFKSILSNYGFTEAYLCEATGSYLFLDGKAQDHGLVVNFADQLDHWVRAGKDKGINLPLLKALKDRKKMMCYHTSSHGIEPDKSHWEIYAHPAKTIQGRRGTYYYAFAPNMYDIDVERVLPFEEYRENQQRKATRLH